MNSITLKRDRVKTMISNKCHINVIVSPYKYAFTLMNTVH